MKRSNQGFSIIELLISSTVFVGLSAVTYSFLNSQQNKQVNAIKLQAQNRASNTAIERFKADSMLIDPNWVHMGVPSVFPHQGYGLGDNYYRNTIMQSEEKLPDAVTFLRRDTEVDRFYTINSTYSKYCIGDGTLDAQSRTLYNTTMNVDGGVTGIEENDWILVFEGGTTALAIVDQKTSSTIRLREPSVLQTQQVQTIGANITGLVTRPGVLQTTVDHKSVYTQTEDDDTACLDRSKLRIQKIGNPVSYFVAYGTTDGEEKSASNLYLLNSKGEKRKMLVRVEYQGDSIEREYLTELSNLAITYDHAADVEGGVETEVGRGDDNQYLLKTNRDYTDDSSDSFDNGIFHYTTGIVAMNMNIINENADPKDPTRVTVKNHNVKASFDGLSGQNTFSESISYDSYVTDNLGITDNITSEWDMNIGRPFFYLDGDQNQEVIVPVWRYMTNGDVFSVDREGEETISDEGRIAIFDNTGCPVNPEEGTCNPSPKSGVQFNRVKTGEMLEFEGESVPEFSKFFPTSVNTIKLGNRTVVLVGGVAMTGAFIPTEYVGDESAGDCRVTKTCGNQSPNNFGLERSPGFATIVVPEGASLKGLIGETYVENSEEDAGPGANCSIQNCSWFNIDAVESGEFESDLSGLMDTANIAVTNSGRMLTVPLTKEEYDSHAGIYEVKVDLSEENEGEVATPIIRRVGSIDATAGGQIVTSISETTLMIDGEEYLAVCTSKPLDTCEEGGACTSPDPDAKGEIRLMHIKDSGGGDVQDTSGVTVAQHNYACNSMTVTEQGDLLVSGRLTVSAISNQELENIVVGGDTSDMRELLLDDIAYETESGPVYADGYQVGDDQYEGSDPQLIGWRGGMSSVSMGDMMGLVATNTVRKGVDGDAISEVIDVGIHLIDLPSSGDQVLVTIETDPINPNNTRISSTYVKGMVEQATDIFPATFIPGNYIVNADQQRTTPTPLPSLGSAMSEYEWYTLFEQLQTPNGAQGLDSEMPAIDINTAQVVDCEASAINTCAQ